MATAHTKRFKKEYNQYVKKGEKMEAYKMFS